MPIENRLEGFFITDLEAFNEFGVVALRFAFSVQERRGSRKDLDLRH
jgi:hypothetical protein